MKVTIFSLVVRPHPSEVFFHHQKALDYARMLNILSNRTSQTWTSTFSLIFKLGVTILALVYVVWKLWEERTHWQWNLVGQNGLAFAFAVSLLPFNLGLEAAKWQCLVKRLNSSFSFGHALKGVLMGISLGILTPNRVGEYAGRLINISGEIRWEAGTFVWVNRLAQMVITLLLGSICWELAIVGEVIQPPLIWENGIRWISWGLLIGLVLFLHLHPFLWRKIHSSFQKFPSLGKIFHAMSVIDLGLMWRVIALSFLRYSVFSAQYVLLLYACGIESHWEIMTLLVFLVFLIKSLAPFASIAELGIREAVAITVGGWLGFAGLLVTTSAFCLYLINLVIPALIGLWFMYKEK
ncbi:MAG: lysylphosphatidylglycerol synthase transmembrane domain-containing protein [Bacteroidota bacterium]